MKQARVSLSVLCGVALLCISSSLEAARFCVTTTADGGKGSLRRAIECANEFPGPHDIEFKIQEEKEPLVIHLVTPLEPITQQIFINGFSQQGSHPAFDHEEAAIRIMLDGAGIDRQQFSVVNGLVFDEGSSGSVVAGLSIVGFIPPLPARSDNVALETGNGIVLNSDCNKICGVYVGVAPKNFVGDTANGFGLLVTGSHNTIGGVTPECRVVVSGNTFDGIVIRSKGLVQSDESKPTGEHNKVLGSYVGIDPSGTEARPNFNGILVLSERNIVGSNSLVSGNRNIGIVLEGSHNTIAETWIGPDVSGFNCVTLPQGRRMASRAIPAPGRPSAGKKRDAAEGDGAQLMGVFIGSSVGATRGHGALASENILSCNLISCNTNAGVVVTGDGNILRGNFIGTGARGKTSLGNGVGLRVDAGKNTSIGGTVKGSGNLISGNQREGVLVRGGTKTSIEGNFIGTNASGAEALPNNKTGIAIGFDSGDGEGQELIADDDSSNVRAVICKNLISGNCENGISVEGQNTVLVSDNVIGLDSAAKAGIPNQLNGIDVRNRAEVVVFSNLIACNGIENELCSVAAKRQPLLQDRCGVRVLFPACVAVLCTSSFNNENKGICTIPALEDGEADADVLCIAPPSPVLNAAKSFGCMIDIKGELHAKPDRTYRIEFFANNTDRGEITEGMRPIGILATLKTNEEGFAEFSLLLQEKPEGVKFVSATATLLEGKDSLTPLSTSEFSLNIRVA